MQRNIPILTTFDNQQKKEYFLILLSLIYHENTKGTQIEHL